MKKRILSCVLALVLLLTLLPAAAAATEADTTGTEEALLCSEIANKNGAGWAAVNETQIHQGLYLPTYGDPYLLYQRIWIGTNGIRSRVTSVTSQNGCYEITRYENGENSGDSIFQFTAKKTGSDTLVFSTADNESALRYPIKVQLPPCAFYSSGTASTDTLLALNEYNLLCTGEERSVWLLTESPLYALSSITLDLDGQRLEPEASTVDGISRYEYTIDGQKLRAEWLSRADGNGNGNGLKLTILSDASSIVLPSAGRQLFISVTAHCSEDAESSTSCSSGTLCLRPDHRINYCYVTSKDNKHVANTATIRSDLRFNITPKEQSTLLAFYYRDPETDALTPISCDNITITPSDGVTISKMSGQDDHILLFSGWKLGTYTISYTAKDGTTYSQPLFVTLPPVGLFTEPVYDFEYYVINSNYERNISTETDALTLWLLCNVGFSSDAEFTVEMDGEKLALDKNGYAALDGKQIAQFQLKELDTDTAGQYGLKITFSDGKALNALFGTSHRLNFSVYVKSERFSTRSRFQISNTDTTPSGPTAELGKNSGSTDDKADTTITGGGCVYVRYEGKVYSISLAHSSDSGALEPVISSFGNMFDEEAVKKNWARGDTLRLAVFTDMTESNYSEAKNMIPKLVKSASFRITDTSYEETGGFLSWDDPVAPTEEAPYYSLYYCISPASGQSGVGYISVDITLKDGVEFVEKPVGEDWQVITPHLSSGKITVQAHSRIQETTTIDCAARGIVTMDALNDFLKNYTFPTGKENRIEIKLAPVAYEGVLQFEGNHPTNAEAVIVSLHGTVDEKSKTVTTIYGGLEIGGHLMVLSDLYVTPHPTDGTKNLTDSSGNTIGLHATQSTALSNVDAVTFDSFNIGLDCDRIGYVCASTCVFKNCGTGIRIDSGAIEGGNNNSEWNGNTFYNCGIGVDLISLPQYISPYRLRFYENNFLNSKEADIRVPADFDDTYYFYRNFFGTLPEGTKLTGSALEGATYANSNIKAGEAKAPDTVIVSPRRKYPIWFGSTPLNVNNYQPAELSRSGSGETDTSETSTQALFAAPMRAAAFSATNADKTSVLTIEMNGKTTIQNENASSLVIDDPKAFENGAAIKVVTRKDSKTFLLGTWEFTKNSDKVNGGFNAGLQITSNSNTISVTVTDSPALSTLTPTLTIPVPTDWKAATVTGPDGKAQYAPINTASVTCSVTKGGLYTIQEATPVWAYDPAITGTTFTAKLHTGMLGTDRSGLTGILAVYDASGRMLACYTESLTGTTFQTTVTAAVLNKAKTFKLFNLGGSSQPLNRSIQWDSSSIKN